MRLVEQGRRRFSAPSLELNSGHFDFRAFRRCIAGSSCVRLRGSWCAGLSAWPRGGKLRKDMVGNDGEGQTQ